MAGDIAVLSWGKRKQSFKDLTNYKLKYNLSLLNDEKE
jgi:hypothetical protein